ncbi:MAG: nitrilase-related carbon-nitrogen hydrolase [Pseudomonadota bacterium]
MSEDSKGASTSAKEGRHLTVSIVQINARDDDVAGNLDKIAFYLEQAGARGTDLAVLPETFTGTGLSSPEANKAIAQSIPGPATDRLAAIAKRYDMMVVGSLFETGEAGRIHNSAPFIGRDGSIQAVYRKTQLFDPAERPDIPTIRESDKVAAGEELVMVTTNVCKVGVGICSDLRFPELFLNYALEGAELVVLPTAFLSPRVDHWEFLLRARATDNQFYVVGSGMVGGVPGTNFGFVGRSMVVDPWGVIVAQAPDRECLITTTIDLDAVQDIRAWWPLNEQRRPQLYAGLGR